MTFSLDLTDVEVGAVINEPLPAGWYDVQLKDCEMKPLRDDKGEYLNVRMEVSVGDHAGRWVFNNYNLWHKDESTQKRARADLKRVCAAIGHDGNLQNGLEPLFNRPFRVQLTIDEGSNGYGPRNRVYKVAPPSKDAEVAQPWA